MTTKRFARPRRRARREGSIEESCRLYAKERGWASRKMNGLGFRDWPDRQFFPPRMKKNGKHVRWTFWVEFKKSDTDLTPSQVIMIADLTARGEIVHVIRSLDEFKKLYAFAPR